MLASDWQNGCNVLDTSNDGHVSSLDALLTIDRLNQEGSGPLPIQVPTNSPLYDTSGNGRLEPLDALLIINALNGNNSSSRFTFNGGLTNDTGSLDDDAITFNDHITARMSSLLGFASVSARVDGGIPVAVSQSCGRIAFDPGLASNGTDDGQHIVSFIGVDPAGTEETFDIEFTLDSQGPVLSANIHADTDTGIPGDGATSVDLVQLTAATEPLQTILFQNTTYVADAAGFVNLGEVSLAPGANAVSLSATDVAGNATTLTPQLTRTPCDFADDLVTGTMHVDAHPILGTQLPSLNPRNAALPLVSAEGDEIQYAMAILNQDLATDFVTVLPDTDEVSVLLNDGSGRLGQETRYASGGVGPTSIYAANFIGDLLPDLAVGHRDGTVSFLEGQANGDYLLRPELTRSGLGSIVDLAAFDFDSDGDNDLVVSGTDRVTLLTNENSTRRSNTILNGRFESGFSGWMEEVLGTPTGGVPGSVTIGDGFAQLVENESFLVTLKQDFVVPSAADTLQFDLLSLGLDSAAGGIPDAFEVSLLSGDFDSVVPTFDDRATAFFNLNPDGEPSMAEGVDFDGLTVTVDISQLQPGSEATLYFDLVGNQPGSHSTATIGNVRTNSSEVPHSSFTASALPGQWNSTAGVGHCDANYDSFQDIVVEQDDQLVVFAGDGSGGFADQRAGGEGEAANRHIQIGEVVMDSLDAAGEIDVFRFSATDGQTLYFDSQDITGLQTWRLTDPNGDEVFNQGLADQENVVLTISGEYTLAISGFFGANGPYQFQIHETPDVNTYAIEMDDMVEGSLGVPGEEIEFTFDASQGQTLFFDAQDGEGVFEWTLLAPNGHILFSGPFIDVEHVATNISGQYVLRMDGPLDTVGDFRFRINDITQAAPTPISLNTEIFSKILLAGTSNAYTFVAHAGRAVYFDVHHAAANLNLILEDSDGSIVVSNSLIDTGPVALPAAGEFTLRISGVGDATGEYGLGVWDVPSATPSTIEMQEIVSGAIFVPGEVASFKIEGTAGQTITFDEIYSSNSLVRYWLSSPTGVPVLTEVSGTVEVPSLPETGAYTLIVDGLSEAVGNFSFRVVEGTQLPSIPESADLAVTSIQTPRTVVGDSATIDVQWETTNLGTVPVPAGTALTTTIHLSGDHRLNELAADPRIAEFATTLAQELAPGESLSRRESINFPENLDAEVQILVHEDARNTVFENQGEGSSNIGSSVIGVFSQPRDLLGDPSIAIDFADGQLLPANEPLTFSGQTSVPVGAVNAIFMLDLSGSTAHITGLDANFDGLTDSADDMNGDDRVGDLLDKEIGLVLQTVSRLEQQYSDLRVGVTAWTRSDAFFSDAGESIDLDSGRFNQVFYNPGNETHSLEEFETAVRSVSFRQQGLSAHAGATQFRDFIIGPGNDYDQALEELQKTLDAAPDADVTQVYFFTDGLFVTAEDQIALDSTIAEVGARGIQFRAAQVVSPAFVDQHCSVALPPSWCGHVDAGDQFVEEALRITEGIDQQSNSTADIVIAQTPNDLESIILQPPSVAGVSVNGRGVEVFDAGGNFFTPITLAPGSNTLDVVAYDSNGREFERSLTLQGRDDDPARTAFTSISPSAGITFLGSTFNRKTTILHVDSALSNQSDTTLRGPVQATFQNFDPLSVQLSPGTSSDASESAWIEFNDEIPTGGLDTGATSGSIALSFLNPQRERFSLEVSLLAMANLPPEFTSVPVTTTQLDADFEYEPTTFDENGDVPRFSLGVSPSGMTVDQATGRLTWTPTPDQLGVHLVTLVVEDGRGGSAVQEFQIEVQLEAVNQPPRFKSVPSTQVPNGANFDYRPIVLDGDGDSLVFSLDDAPAGMSFDAATGRLNWLADNNGNHNVSLRVDDNSGGSATQTFVLTVGDNAANPGTPNILSTPPTIAAVDQPYLYLPLAQDPDGDQLLFSLVTAPSEASIDPETGKIDWQPETAQRGPNVFTLRADDGRGGIATQFFTVDVLQDPPNRAPVFTSVPYFLATQDSHYQYSASAVDPDNDPLAFVLIQGPNGLDIDSTGMVSFRPDDSQLGIHRVTIQVADSAGTTSTQSFDLEVRGQNEPPMFTTVPPPETTIGNTFIYDANADDTEDAVSYSLFEAPSGMTLDPVTGLLAFTPNIGSQGLHPVTILASDERGAFSEQTFVLEVIPDSRPPVVTVVLSQDVVHPGETVQVQVVASDNVELTSVGLELDGAVIPLDSSNMATIDTSTPGLFELSATAIDSSGNVGHSMELLRIVDPTDSTPPSVIVSSPAPGAQISYITDIIGTVSADDLEYFRVDYAPSEVIDSEDIAAANSAWVTLAESSAPVAEDVLAQLDPTTLPNGNYLVRIFAQDFSGNANVQAIPVDVSGPAKLGVFDIEFVDLSIPLAGLPIEVTRRYSSLDSQASGDFGFGWNMSLGDADIRETVAPPTDEQIGVFGNTPFVYGTRVYLNNPDGERIGFTFEPERTDSFFGDAYLPKFTPDPGTYDQLVVDPITLSQRDDGSFVAFLVGFPYNPSDYTLVRPDGTAYTYNETSGLQSISDRNGNQLTFTPDGVSHSSGVSVDFQRDALGRITQIIDPAGNEIQYQYDVRGDLTAVVDRTNQTTQFTYHANPVHLLDRVIDSRGIVVQQVEYDSLGRVTSLIDALGNRSVQNWDVDSFTGTITDANMNVTHLVYNDRGNVIQATDPFGNTIFFEYTDPRHPDLETRTVDRRGYVTEWEYDEQGNIIKFKEIGHQDAPFADPIVTTYMYNEFSQLTDRTDARLNTFSQRYDDNGNLIEAIDELGNSSTRTYDALGRLETFTDRNLNEVILVYGDSDQPSKIIYADDTFMAFQYNQLSQVTQRDTHEADGTLVETTAYRYDKNGRQYLQTVGAGEHQSVIYSGYNGTLLEYRAVVHPDSMDDQGTFLESPDTPTEQRKSAIKDFEYDDNGRQVRQIDANGGVTEFRYDANGNTILVQDPIGNITTWVYDALNRASEMRDSVFNAGLSIEAALLSLETPSGASCATDAGAPHVVLSCFDEEGNQTKSIDRNGQRREFTYDHAGRLTEETWFDDTNLRVHTISFVYDQVGNLISASDDQSRYAFTYDERDRLIQSDNNPDQSLDIPRNVLTYRYDNDGNLIRTEDNSGVYTESEYNARSRLSARNWSGTDIDSVRVEWAYDAIGRETQIERFADLSGQSLVGRTLGKYDLASQATEIEHRDAVDQILAQFEYEYDHAGLLAAEQLTRPNSTVERRDYRTDLRGQLLESLVDGQSTGIYSYDANGNRNAPEMVTSPGNRLERDANFAYSYDAEGNLLSKTETSSGAVTTFEYDHRHRLVRVEQKSSQGILLNESEFAYDVFDRRIAKTTNGALLHTVYDMQHAWADFDESHQVSTRYLYGNETDDILARHRTATGTAWYLKDRLGSVQALANSSGESLAQIEYGTFGNLLSVDNPEVIDRFLFTGRELDSEFGMYHYRARTYDPTQGRFTTMDPLGFNAGDLNLFRYVANSPMNYTDPTGHATAPEYTALQTIPTLIIAHVTTFLSGIAAGACTGHAAGSAGSGAAVGGGLGMTGGAVSSYSVLTSASPHPGVAVAGALRAVGTAISVCLIPPIYNAVSSIPPINFPTPTPATPSPTPTVTGGQPIFLSGPSVRSKSVEP